MKSQLTNHEVAEHGFEPPASIDTRNDVDVNELAALSGLSVSTLWRMKRAGDIPYYQRGKSTRVTFPRDAIKATLSTCTGHEVPKPRADDDTQKSNRSPGPLPDWMKKRLSRKDN